MPLYRYYGIMCYICTTFAIVGLLSFRFFVALTMAIVAVLFIYPAYQDYQESFDKGKCKARREL